jgi:hypothetical protein
MDNAVAKAFIAKPDKSPLDYSPSDGSQSYVCVDGSTLALLRQSAPSCSEDDGVPGEFRCDGNYIYYCKDHNEWVRSKLNKW